MNSTLKIWEANRQAYLKFLGNYTLEQLNRIPEGFSNNLIWNVGHIIVTQQALIYRLSGLPAYIPDELTSLYKSGTKPLRDSSQEEVDELKNLLTLMVEKTRTDIQNNIFTTYHEKTTSTGFHIGSLDDAIVFNTYHEGLHLGYMMSIRKFL